MGNKTGRQKSQEQGEGEGDTNIQEDDTLNIVGDQSAEQLGASTKTADEQTEEGDDKETKKDDDLSKPIEGTTTVNEKEKEQISGEVQKNLVEQSESELKEQASDKGDTSTCETKADLAGKKQIDSREENEEQKIVVSSEKYQEKMSEGKKTSEQKEESDSVAEGHKDVFIKVDDRYKIAFSHEKVDDGQIEPSVQEEEQIAESIKKSEAVPQQEEKVSQEMPSEEASFEPKEQPESCAEVSKDEVMKTDQGFAEALDQVQSKGDQVEPEVQEQEQVAESIKQSKTVPQVKENNSNEFPAHDAHSEQMQELESFGEVSKDEVLKTDENHAETTKQVNVEDDQPESEVQEQEQIAESTKTSENAPHQEEDVSNEIPAQDAPSGEKQLESAGEVSKDKVLKDDERRTSEQVNVQEDQPELEVQEQEQAAESTKKSETVPQQEENVLNKIPADDTSSEQPEPNGEGNKDNVLKAVEGCIEVLEQLKVEDNQQEPEVQKEKQVAESTKESESVRQKEENVSDEILAREGATCAQGEHTMVPNTSSKEAYVEGEKAEEASMENTETKQDDAGGKEESAYAEQVKP